MIARLFEITEEEMARFKEWVKEHDKTCSLPVKDDGSRCGTIGDRFSFSFSPTSLGTIVGAKCGCGEKVLLSDFDQF